MLLAIGIFVATITLVIWQPRGLGIGWSAIGGALMKRSFGTLLRLRLKHMPKTISGDR